MSNNNRNINKLYHFPKLHKGDCFYDLLARYHAESAHLTSRATSLELFGNCPDLRPSITLPYRAELIYSWLGPDSNISMETLRNRHSAWQYIQLSHEFSDEAMKPILRAESKPGRRKQTKMIFSLQEGIPYLRYCPTCLIADQMKETEPFWHQIHQLKGVKYCPFHGTPLKNSTIPLNKRLFRYIPANDMVDFSARKTIFQADTQTSPREESFFKDDYIALARTIYSLLEHGLELGSQEELKHRYSLALEKNVEYVSGDYLMSRIVSYWSVEFLKDLFPVDISNVFLNSDIEAGLNKLSPLGHALLITALQMDVQILNYKT